jgi:hypothetical protein
LYIVATSKIAFVIGWNYLGLFEAEKFTWLFQKEKKGGKKMKTGRHEKSI